MIHKISILTKLGLEEENEVSFNRRKVTAATVT